MSAPVTEPIDLSLTLEELEARYIVAILVDSAWNISEAARRLGIYRSSLQRRMKKGALHALVRAELARRVERSDGHVPQVHQPHAS